MTAPAGLGFDRADTTPLVVSPGRAAVTRGELASMVADLAQQLREARWSRVLVCSDDPVRILSAVEASTHAGADLWIAHTSLPADMRADVISRTGAHGWLDDAGNHPAADGDPVWSGQRRIHMMTSGTTGRPKIAAHTLDSLLGRVRRQAGQSTNRDGRWLLTYQPTGFAGLQVMLTAALSGGTIVTPRQRTPAGFLEAARDFNVTQVSATPTFWRAFLSVAPKGSVDLKQITIGGEGVDQATLDRVRLAYPEARVTHIYASTEAGVVFAVHDGREGFPAEWLDRPNQGVELSLRDGFLHIRTPNAMQGYTSEADQPLLDDGWLATADRCEVVGDRVRVLGRQDSMINVAGSKVYPLAVETFLLALPGVLEARVFGVPNPISGYLVAADVVIEPGESPETARPRIMAACREGLPSYQIPRVLKFVDAIDVRESGKKG